MAWGFAKCSCCVWEPCGGCYTACHSCLFAQCVVMPLCSWCTPQWALPGCQGETEASEIQGVVSKGGPALSSQREEKRDLLLAKETSSQAELPLLWDSHTYHILKETLLVMKNLQVSLPVLQIKCSECGGNRTVWVDCGFALPFLDLAFYLGLLVFQTLCLHTRLLL